MTQSCDSFDLNYLLSDADSIKPIQNPKKKPSIPQKQLVQSNESEEFLLLMQDEEAEVDHT